MATEKNESSSSQVLEYLRNGIVTRRWKIGDRLPTEKDLCERFGVSRTTVRSAIQQLTVLGLARTVQGSGTYVRQGEPEEALEAIAPSILFHQDDLLSLLEFRRIIEVGAAGLAAQRAATEDVNALFRSARRMQEAVQHSEIVRYDMEFHTLIAHASRNFAIIKVFDIMKESYLSVLDRNVASLGTRGAEQHLLIAKAVASGSAEQAKSAMSKHLAFSASLYFKDAEDAI